jgi:hypothetical protein
MARPHHIKAVHVVPAFGKEVDGLTLTIDAPPAGGPPLAAGTIAATGTISDPTTIASMTAYLFPMSPPAAIIQAPVSAGGNGWKCSFANVPGGNKSYCLSVQATSDGAAAGASETIIVQ